MQNLTLLKTLVAALSLFIATSISAGPFDKGKMNVSLVVGAGTAFNQNYTIVGAGLDYFVLHGLQLGVDAQAWLGGDRSIYKISPQARYVLDTGTSLKPYIGAFYRKTYIENLDDLESVGGRAGVYLRTDGRYSLSAGVVFENYLDCNDTVFNNCSETYPELVFSFAI
ncbi:MAG: hypothetical protein WBN96_13465 [Gammaproteobacteria bacterium]|jgi:hypothetical protein